MWARLMSSTNQPNFARYERAIQQQRKANAQKQEEAEKLRLKPTNGASKEVSPQNLGQQV
jgi:6-phosphofructokinase 1